MLSLEQATQPTHTHVHSQYYEWNPILKNWHVRMYVMYYLELEKHFFEFSEHDRQVPFCCKYLLLYWDSSVVFCQFRLFQHSYFYWRLEPYLSHVVYFTLHIRCEMPNYLFFGGLLRRNGPFSVVSRLSNQSLYTQFTVKWHTSGVVLIFQYHWLNRKKVVFPFGTISTIGNIGNVEGNEKILLLDIVYVRTYVCTIVIVMKAWSTKTITLIQSTHIFTLHAFKLHLIL